MPALMVLIVRKAESEIGMATLMMVFTQVTYMVMNFFVPFSFDGLLRKWSRLIAFAGHRGPGLDGHQVTAGNPLLHGESPAHRAG